MHDLHRIFDGHRAHRVEQQRLGCGHRRLRGAVHRIHQVVHAALLADRAQHLGRAVECARQRDLHLRIVEKAARLAKQRHGAVGAAFERGAHAGSGLGFTEREGAGGLAQQRETGGPREQERGEAGRKLTSLHCGLP